MTSLRTESHNHVKHSFCIFVFEKFYVQSLACRVAVIKLPVPFLPLKYEDSTVASHSLLTSKFGTTQFFFFFFFWGEWRACGLWTVRDLF
jgi:hypothetical protein